MRANIKLILIYTVLAGLLAALISPLPGTSLLLTGLEILMLVHLAKRNKFELKLGNLGFFATALWGILNGSQRCRGGTYPLCARAWLGGGGHCRGCLRVLFGHSGERVLRQMKAVARATLSRVHAKGGIDPLRTRQAKRRVNRYPIPTE